MFKSQFTCDYFNLYLNINLNVKHSIEDFYVQHKIEI